MIVMPERKGRKRRPTHDRRRDRDVAGRAAATDAKPDSDGGPPPDVRAPRRAAASDGPLPSTTARVTGLMIAVLTAFLAILMMYEAATGDLSGIDAVLRIVAGVTLVALAVVVGLLSLAPGQVRNWLRRRR